MNYHFKKASPIAAVIAAILFVFNFSEAMSDQYRLCFFNLILGISVMASRRLVCLVQMKDSLPE
jgi:hypothetical protein